MKKHIEYKKIILAIVVAYVFIYLTIGRILMAFGIFVDSSTDVALIYAVIGSYVAYCTASATDKHNLAKYNPSLGTNYEKGDGNE